MPRVYARAVVPRRPFPNKAAAKAILKAAAMEIAKLAVKYLQTFTADWEHQPEWGIRVKVDLLREIVIYVFPTGPNADIFKWVSGGTKRHPITPKNAPVLYFNTDYRPRTSGGGRYKGPGKAVGPGVFAVAVDHPGSYARHIEASIAQWLRQRKDVARIMKNAMARAKRAIAIA